MTDVGGNMAHGIHYVMPNGEKLFFGQHRVSHETELRALSPLARAVLRCHLEAAIKLLDSASVRASINAK